MSRRSLTLLLASLLALALTTGAATAAVPYVALGPGPTYDTLGEVEDQPVLAIKGRQTFPTDGHLDLTTVKVHAPLTLVQALQGWFASDMAVVPREVIYPPDQTKEEADEANAEAMTASQSDATLAAARQLGFVVAEVRVRELAPGSPAEGSLRAGDVLTTVDGEQVRDAADLRSRIGATDVGQAVQVGFLRDGTAGTAEVRTAAAPDDDGGRRAVIGVVTEQEPVRAPFDVEIRLEDVGGPSAGLMFTLGILDRLGEASLTGGKYIAGTGEISPDGTVGAIGGIPQKLVAAQRKGADAFLVPADNCAEAVRSPPAGLPLVRVASLTDALDGLQALRRGEQPELCPA